MSDRPRAEQEWFERSRGRTFPETIELVLTFHVVLAIAIAELDQQTRLQLLNALDRHLDNSLEQSDLTDEAKQDIRTFRNQLHQDIEEMLGRDTR